MSASEVLGSIVDVRSFSMIVSILEVSPRKFAGLRTVHFPSLDPNVRCSFAPLISKLLNLSKSTGIRRLSRRSFRLLSKFAFVFLGTEYTLDSPETITDAETPVGASSRIRTVHVFPSLHVA